MEIKYNKTSNDIEDICIVNGLCTILDMNDIEWELINNKSHYLIITEEFDESELIYIDLEENDGWSLYKCVNQAEKIKNIDAINKFFNDNINNIFNMVQDNTKLNKNETNAIAIGNHFHSLGLRGSVKKKSCRTSLLRRNLSFLGHMKSMNYKKNDDIEINTVLIPKKTNSILRLKQETKKGNKNTFIASGMSQLEGLAKLYLDFIYEFNYLLDNYKELKILQLKPAGQKPMPDKSFSLEFHEWSLVFCEELNKKLTYSNIPMDVKMTTANFIVNPKYNTFSQLIKVYGKNKAILNMNFKEEFLKMCKDKHKEIFNNESIIKIGRKLNELLRNDKGYDILVKLYSGTNKTRVMKIISRILDEYKRRTGYSALSSDELIEINNLINDKKDAQIVSDAILAYSRVFYQNKQNNNELKNNNEMEEK